MQTALTTNSVITAFMNSRSCSVLLKPSFWIGIPGCQIQVSLTSSYGYHPASIEAQVCGNSSNAQTFLKAIASFSVSEFLV